MKALTGTHLKRFLRDYRREHPSHRRLAALLQSVAYPTNVGSIFRLADGLDVAELVLTGITPTPPHPTIDKVGRAKSRRVPWRYEKEAVDGIGRLRSSGYQIVALELTEDAVPYHTFSYADHCCLVVGHEDHGLTQATLAACDAAVFVPMYGKGRSLNVHVALAIVGYHARHSP